MKTAILVDLDFFIRRYKILDKTFIEFNNPEKKASHYSKKLQE